MNAPDIAKRLGLSQRAVENKRQKIRRMFRANQGPQLGYLARVYINTLLARQKAAA